MTDNRKEPTLSPLKPEQDEIVRHRQRTSNGGAGRNGNTPRRPTTGPQRPVVVVRSKLAPFAFLLAITALGLAGFAYWQLLDAQKQAAAAEVRIAELEGLLKMTGNESEASMAAMRAKLKWADSEIRKLWGVSYDTNRGNIAENKQAIAAVRQQVSGVESQVDTALEDLRSEMQAISNTVAAQQATVEEVAQGRLQLQQQTQQVADSLRQLEEAQTALQNRVQTTEQAIAAIDAFRRSVSRDILELKSQIAGTAKPSTAP